MNLTTNRNCVRLFLALLAPFACQPRLAAQVKVEAFGDAALQTITNLTTSAQISPNRSAGGKIDIQVKETLVGRIPDEMRLDTLSRKQDATTYWRGVERIGAAWLDRVAISSDQHHLAIVEKQAGKSVAVVDGKPGPAFDDIPNRPWFSPDSQRLAYVARRGDSCCMVLDGIAGPNFDPWSGMYPIFSPDSQALGYAAQRGGNTVVIVGQSQSTAYKSIHGQPPPPIVFSPNSKRYGYCAELLDRSWVVVVDGEESKPYISKGRPMFSADSEHVFYAASRGVDSFLVLDGVETALPKAASLQNYVLSPAGKRVACRLQLRNGHEVVQVDGKSGTEYAFIDPELRFSPDSQRFAYAAKKGKKACVVLDGKESPVYDGIAEMPVFSPDSKHVAWAAKRGSSTFVVRDGVESKGYGDVYHLVFSPDSKHMAYGATRRLSAFVVQDEKEGPSFLFGAIEGSLLEVLFSPDSQRLAYRISIANKSVYVVVDGNKSNLHEDVKHGSLCFSPDSKHVAFWGTHFGKWHVFVDGAASDSYDKPLDGSKLAFDALDGLTGLAQRSNAVLRLDIKIKAPR